MSSLALRISQALRDEISRTGSALPAPSAIGQIDEDEPCGSPEFLASLDRPELWAFAIEARGRTLRVMVEDVTPTLNDKEDS